MDKMVTAKREITAVKGWATSHIVLAAVVAFALGIFIGALLF
jgi:hypothetical protein